MSASVIEIDGHRHGAKIETMIVCMQTSDSEHAHIVLKWCFATTKCVEKVKSLVRIHVLDTWINCRPGIYEIELIYM